MWYTLNNEKEEKKRKIKNAYEGLKLAGHSVVEPAFKSMSGDVRHKDGNKSTATKHSAKHDSHTGTWRYNTCLWLHTHTYSSTRLHKAKRKAKAKGVDKPVHKSEYYLKEERNCKCNDNIKVL